MGNFRADHQRYIFRVLGGTGEGCPRMSSLDVLKRSELPFKTRNGLLGANGALYRARGTTTHPVLIPTRNETWRIDLVIVGSGSIFLSAVVNRRPAPLWLKFLTQGKSGCPCDKREVRATSRPCDVISLMCTLTAIASATATSAREASTCRQCGPTSIGVRRPTMYSGRRQRRERYISLRGCGEARKREDRDLRLVVVTGT